MMESAEFSGARIGNFSAQGIAAVSHADDKNLLVQFYHQAVRQGGASEREGRDIYKDEEYVWIRFPGDRTKEVKRPVDLRGTGSHAPDPVRWPQAWAAFKNSGIQVQEGTPLEQFPVLGTSTVMNFKAYNIHTVEQLASVSDAVIHNLGTGAMDLREKAKIWLKAAKDVSQVTFLQTELSKRDTDIAALKHQLAELSALVESQTKKGK
jgi:hypothetical protein